MQILCNLGGIHAPVEELKECTDAVKARFPATARVHSLNEIFKVRELEERFERGEVGKRASNPSRVFGVNNY